MSSMLGNLVLPALQDVFGAENVEIYGPEPQF